MKYENEFFEDMMGVTIETGDAFLDKKLNSHICYKGGGNRTTQTSSLPEWLKPHITGLLGKGEAAYNQGNLSEVAGFTADQQAAQRQGRQAAGAISQQGGRAATAQTDALTGTGLFGAQDFTAQKEALGAEAGELLGRNLAGQRASSAASGTPGSFRSELAKNEAGTLAQSQLAGQLAQLDSGDRAARRGASQSAVGQTGAVQQGLGAGAQARGQIGSQIQDQRQKEADATYQGLQRLGSLFGVAQSTPQDKTQRAGGGK